MTELLRVAFLFGSTGIGGAERSMLRLAAYADKRRWDCRLVSIGRGNDRLLSAAKDAGVAAVQFPSWDLAGLWRYLSRESVSVAYLFGHWRVLPWALVAHAAGVGAIIGAERGSGRRWRDRTGRWLDQWLLQAYIANSSHGARALKHELWPTRAPVYTIRNGLPESRSPAAPMRSPAFARRPVIACVANLNWNKGQLVLLEAVRMLRSQWVGATAVLAGDDQTNGEFAREARRRGLGSLFWQLGFVEDVRECLRQSDVFVLPSVEREGCPTAVLEAMRANCPVVASRVDGMEELVEDGRTGWLVEPGNAEALAATLDAVLRDADARRARVRSARTFADRRASMAAMADEHERVFLGVLRARGTRRAVRTLSGMGRDRGEETGSPRTGHVSFGAGRGPEE